MKQSFPFFLVLFLCAASYAQEVTDIACRSSLTAGEVERVKTSKHLFYEVAPESLQATVKGLEKAGCPSIQVLMMEAMAKTYTDLVGAYDVQDKGAKERLYHKIQLNMAYLQFTAGKAESKGSPLDRLIRQKLIAYLPAVVLDHPRFFHSVE